MLGLIEGISDAAAGVARFAGGALADDPGRRRRVAVGGYTTTAVLSAANALHRDGGMLAYDVGACTACGRCAAEAPHAVTASGEFELATTDRSVLIKQIPLRGETR